MCCSERSGSLAVIVVLCSLAEGETVDWDSDIGKAIQKSALPAKDEINFVIGKKG